MSEPKEREEDESPIQSGMTEGPTPDPSPKGEGKRAPRWTSAFLRGLERSGDARASATDAGIDHSTAYARRRAHGDFALAWEAALAAHGEAKDREEAEEIAATMRWLTS